MALSDMPTLGVASWNIAAPTLSDRVGWIVDNGFTGASLHVSVMDCEDRERLDAADTVRDAGLGLTFHGIVGYTESNALDVDRFERLMHEVLWWQERTGAVHCVCYDPMYSASESGEQQIDWNANRRVILMTQARLGPYGIRTGIENAFGGEDRYRSIGQIRRLKEVCRLPAMGMLLDTGHANIHVRRDGVAGESDIGTFVRAVPLEILEVHFSDNHGERDEHLPLGSGNLDLAGLMGALKDVGFDGHFTVEVCPGLERRRLDVPEQMDQILTTRDAIRSAWEALE